jgi:hypothetical protein
MRWRNGTGHGIPATESRRAKRIQANTDSRKHVGKKKGSGTMPRYPFTT